MHNDTLNTVLARLLRITTPKRHQKDISAHIVFQDNTVCVAEFIHIQHQRRLHRLHIFDWPFADFGSLSPATLTAATHYLEEQLQQAAIRSKNFCFVLPSNQISSRQSTLPFSSLTALKKDLKSAAFIAEYFDLAEPEKPVCLDFEIIQIDKASKNCQVVISFVEQKLIAQLTACTQQIGCLLAGVTPQSEAIFNFGQHRRIGDEFAVIICLSTPTPTAYIIAENRVWHQDIELNEFDLILLEQAIFKTPDHSFSILDIPSGTSQSYDVPFWDDIAVRVSQAIIQSIANHPEAETASWAEGSRTPLYFISTQISPAHSGWCIFAHLLSSHLENFHISLLPLDDLENIPSSVLELFPFSDLADWVNICAHTDIGHPHHPALIAMNIGNSLAFPSWYEPEAIPSNRLKNPDIGKYRQISQRSKQLFYLKRQLVMLCAGCILGLALLTFVLIFPDFQKAQQQFKQLPIFEAEFADIEKNFSTTQIILEESRQRRNILNTIKQHTENSSAQDMLGIIADSLPLHVNLSHFHLHHDTTQTQLEISGESASINRVNIFASILQQTDRFSALSTTTEEDADTESIIFKLHATILPLPTSQTKGEINGR